MGFSELLGAVDRQVGSRLGETVIYTPGSGAPVSVNGVFDAVYVHVDAGQAGISSSGPAVFLRTESLPSDPRSDTGVVITRQGVNYNVHEVQPDGQGAVILLLYLA